MKKVGTAFALLAAALTGCATTQSIDLVNETTHPIHLDIVQMHETDDAMQSIDLGPGSSVQYGSKTDALPGPLRLRWSAPDGRTGEIALNTRSPKYKIVEVDGELMLQDADGRMPSADPPLDDVNWQAKKIRSRRPSR